MVSLKKCFFVFGFFALSENSFSLEDTTTSLDFPVLVVVDSFSGDKIITATDFNAVLNSHHIQENIPETLNLTSRPQTEKIIEELGGKIFSMNLPMVSWKKMGLYDYGSIGDYADEKIPYPLCYRGDAVVAITLISTLCDLAFIDLTTVMGWRYKDKRYVYDVYFEDENEFLEKLRDTHSQRALDTWTSWSNKGEAILLIYAEDDEMSDYKAAVVEKCN